MSAQEKETNVQTYNNNHLTVIVTKKPHCQVKFEITLDQQAVEAFYQKAIKTVSKEISIPGFRKGKAPSHFVIEKYPSAIKEEFIDAVLQNGFNEALQLTQIHPLKDSLKSPLIKECSKEKGAHFIVEFEERLTPPNINLQEITVKRVTPQLIEEKDLNDAIQQLLLRMATFTPITERPVQKDDFVNLQVILFGDLPKVIENHRVQVNLEMLPNWLFQAIIGLNAGETIEGTTESTPDASEEIHTEHSTPFKATVSSIWEAKTPELNDELIEKIGLKSVQDLEEKMKERLEQTSIEDAFDQQSILIERALLDTYSLDIPKSYLDEEYKIRLEEYLAPLVQQNLSDYIETHRKSIEEKIKIISIERLSIYFMLHVVAIKNQITPSSEDMSREFYRQKALISIGRGNLTANNQEELEKQLYNLAMEQKIKQFLHNSVTFIED